MSDDVLADLGRARRQRRAADVDWFELLYQAYLTVIGCGIALVAAAGVIGDAEVPAGTLARIGDEGPAIAGLAVAAVVVAGLRSGARGGPLALEAAFVQHVLLAPVDRAAAMREPALRLVRQAAIAGGGSGGMAGLLAAERLPSSTLGLVAGGAAGGATTALLAVGLAMVVGGTRRSMWVADAASLVLVGLAAVDVATGTTVSPTTWVGGLALSAVEPSPLGAAGPVLAVAAVVAGVLCVGGTSLEASRRRAGLVSNLRFAVTRQDLRTVVLLQRRLAQDRARTTPWIRLGRRGRTPAVWRRGWQGLLRLPSRRLVRMAVLGGLAVAACAGVWAGNHVLVVVGGLLLHAVALDAIEPLAQELDHPDRWSSFPQAPGRLLVSHLAAPAALLLLAATPVVAVVAATSDPDTTSVAIATAVSACVGATVAAAATVATSPFDLSQVKAFVPEAIGMQLVARVAWPPALTTLSLLPLVVGRTAVDRGDPAAPVATTVMWGVAIAVIAASVWLSHRKPVVV